MLEFSDIREIRGWFTQRARDSDVVLSSRARLARNIFGHVFPLMLCAEEEELVRDEVLHAVKGLPNADQFDIIYLDRLEPAGRRILLERNIYSQEYSLAPKKAVAVSHDAALSVVINDEDHLRLSCVEPGLALREAHRRADELDTALEEELHFAASLEWGYLTTSVLNLGTGLRASAMAHLPALAVTNLLDKTVKTAAGMGLSVKGFFGDGSGSLGDMYQISNQFTLGTSEEEILSLVGDFMGKVADFERRARDDLVSKRRAEMEDRVYRALGTLRYCRFLSAREAIELLAKVRLGVALGLLEGLDLETVTPLLFLCQKSHIQKVLNQMDAEVDSKLVDYTRARVIRDALAGA